MPHTLLIGEGGCSLTPLSITTAEFVLATGTYQSMSLRIQRILKQQWTYIVIGVTLFACAVKGVQYVFNKQRAESLRLIV